jgi:hypothetical protein
VNLTTFLNIVPSLKMCAELYLLGGNRGNFAYCFVLPSVDIYPAVHTLFTDGYCVFSVVSVLSMGNGALSRRHICFSFVSRAAT